MRQPRRSFVSRTGRRIFARLGHSVCLWGACCLDLAAGAGPVLAQNCVPPPAGIIAWWPGETNANDISGHANHAQLHNGATVGVPGHVGRAFQFDGLDDIAQTSLLLPQQGTIELWVNPTTLIGTHGILGTFGLANGNDRLWMAVTGAGGGPGVGPNRLAVNLGSCCVNDFDIATPLTPGVWTHLALTFDYTADSYVLYVDGQAVAFSTAPRNAPSQALRFGGIASDFGQNFFFHGLMDEVTVYDRVLEAAELLAIFQAGNAGKCTTHADLDGDGVLADRCPETVLNPTVVLDHCDAGVANSIFPSGCSLTDLLTACATDAHTHRQFVRCATKVTRELTRLGVLTEVQQTALQRCVEQADLP